MLQLYIIHPVRLLYLQLAGLRSSYALTSNSTRHNRTIAQQQQPWAAAAAAAGAAEQGDSVNSKLTPS